jgi:hypothetical protein
MTIGFQPFCVRILETLTFGYLMTCVIWFMPSADSETRKQILENMIIGFQPFGVRILETSTFGYLMTPILKLKN